MLVSLTGPLLGIFLDVPDAPSEDHLRLALNASKLKRLWCSTYPADYRFTAGCEPVYRKRVKFNDLLDSGYATYAQACIDAGIGRY